MAERPRISLPFGAGLDRATGVTEVQPASFRDLRNVILYDGKAQARRGLVAAGQLSSLVPTAMDDVLALAAFRATGQVMAVGWTRADRVVEAFAANSLGGAPAPVDDTDAHSTWFTADARIGRPIATMAESYKKVFLAHYFHPYRSGLDLLRARTLYYDPAAVAGSKLVPLNLDLGGGADDVRFAGVVPYLNYVFGWGYGNKNEPDRPEMVRACVPGTPTDWKPEHYFVAGVRGDPVTVCAPAGQVLSVFKESETYEIFGYDRTTFGIRPADPRFGCAGPRLAVTVGGTCYFWSLQGPRATQGGASQELAIPLDLNAPAPSDLVAEGEATFGFAVYDPVYRRILFCFPNESQGTTRVYALHIRNLDRPRWSYDVIGQRVTCAAVFASSQVTSIPSDCYPDADPATEVTSSTANLHHINHGNAGDETVEYWMRVSPAGAWSKKWSGPVSGVGDTQTVPVGGLTPEATYDVARRYYKNGLYNPGAENTADPSTWPALSRDQVVMTALVPAPTGFHWVQTVDWYAGVWLVAIDFAWDGEANFEIWIADNAGMVGAQRIPLFDGYHEHIGIYGSTASTARTATIERPGIDYYFQIRSSSPLSEFSTPPIGPYRYETP